LRHLRDYRLSGYVAHVGRSSMEVCMQVDSSIEGDSSDVDGQTGQWETRMHARFVMVARDVDGHAASVPKLRLVTDRDAEINAAVLK
jgi:acyl-CoA hydrolase